MITRLRLIFIAACLFVCVLPRHALSAFTTPEARSVPAIEGETSPLQTRLGQKDSLATLMDTLKALHQRIERLQGVLDKVTFGPQSYYFTRLRSWVIPLSDALNDTICRYFFEVLDNDSSFLESRGDIQVIATPEPSTDLVALYFAGNSKERKGQRLREALEMKPERNMYRQILESREYSEDKELIDRQFRIADLSAPKLVKDADSVLFAFDRYSYATSDDNNETIVTIRLFDDIRVRFGDMWGLEARIGNEELSHPFWTSGNLNFFILYNQIKLGGHIPFKWGTVRDAKGLSSIWKPRNLSGTYGVTAEFDWAFAGGSLFVGFPRSDADGVFPDTAFVYTIKGAGTIWYSFTVNINNSANLLRMKIGLGAEHIGVVEQIRRGGRTIELSPFENRFLWSPYGKAEFMNQQFARRFGASIQYFRDWLLAGIWMEVIPEQLRVEAKFTTLITRTRDPWEPPYFFTVSIPYTFSF
ncbi:MAG: hypothetical protein C4326_09770 [Ignavibacteria bacterium]